MRVLKMILWAGVLLFVSQLKAQLIDSNFVDGRIYVKVHDTSSLVLSPYNNADAALNLIIQQYAVDTITQPFPGLDNTLDKTYCIHFSSHAQADQLVAALQLLPFIEYAEKAPIFRISSTPFTPNDLHAQQGYLDQIFARDAWGVSQGNPNIVVAIVDNGMLTTHEDLAPVLWVNPTPNSGLLDRYPNDVNGWDVADNNNNPNPPPGTTDASPFSHGTLCAGLAGAKTNNGVGMASIGFNIRIMPVKCTPNSSDGNTLTNAYDGVYYAIQAGADVISMSWGGSGGPFLTGESIINSATNAGIVLVGAAGNGNVTTPEFPAAYPNVIAVAAVDGNDVKAGYSNYGSWVDISAPGNGLYTTRAGSTSSYGTASGTSIATPLVAGLAALILSEEPGLSPAQVKTRLQQSSDNIDALNPTFVGQLGAGRINAARAMGTEPTIISGTADALALEAGLKLYPNPATSHVTFELPYGVNILEVSLHNLAGQNVMNVSTEQPNNLLKVALNDGLVPGFYIWKIETDGGTLSRSWIKY